MKVLMLVLPERIQRYTAPGAIPADWELVYVPAEADDDQVLAAGGDCDFLFADAMRPVSGRIIRGMPNLKLIHSEGVGYNAIDVAQARALGIPVCNCAGVNAPAVAEQTVLLMLGVLKKVCPGHAAVRAGHQIDFKVSFAQSGIPELGEMTVGFLGFGAIARAVAARLAPFGCPMLYYDPYLSDREEERTLGIRKVTLDELYAQSDILSLHVPVTPETRGMINADAIGRMKPGVILINTARGEMVCQEDLAAALISGQVGGAGLDVYSPEPVTPDNPLLHLPESCMDRVLFSPHIGGLTQHSFRDAQARVWANFRRVAAGEAPQCVVN